MLFLNNLKELFPIPNVAVVFGAANLQPFLTLPNKFEKIFNFFFWAYFGFLFLAALKELWGCKSSIVMIQSNYFLYFLSIKVLNACYSIRKIRY